MVLDIIIALILIICCINGLRHGFLYTFVSTFGWLIALVGAFFATPYVSDYLKNNTKLVSDFMPDTSDLANLNLSIPDVVGQVTTDIILSFFTFVGLFIIFKIILSIIVHFLKRDDNGGFTSFINGFAGLLFGFLKAAIIIYLGLALMLPISEFFMPELATHIQSQLNNSFVAQSLYDDNLLLSLVKNYLPS